SVTIYRVEFQLSATGQQSIHLVGPSGGLRIATCDVNGDDIPDLIVSVAWREEPLGVLVNDGRGAFSLAALSSFPRAFGWSGKTLNCKLPPQTDSVATPPKLPVGDFSGSKYLLHPSPATDRKSTRLNSSHVKISYAVFCLKKKKVKNTHANR